MVFLAYSCGYNCFAIACFWLVHATIRWFFGLLMWLRCFSYCLTHVAIVALLLGDVWLDNVAELLCSWCFWLAYVAELFCYQRVPTLVARLSTSAMMEFLKFVPAVIGRLVVSVMSWAPSGHISCRISSSLQPNRYRLSNNQSETVIHTTNQIQSFIQPIKYSHSYN